MRWHARWRRFSNALQNFMNGALIPATPANKSNVRTSPPFLYRPSIERLYRSTKSAIAIGHFSFDLGTPLPQQKISSRKIEKISESKANRMWLYILPASDPLIHGWLPLRILCPFDSIASSLPLQSRRPALSKFIQQRFSRFLYAPYRKSISRNRWLRI